MIVSLFSVNMQACMVIVPHMGLGIILCVAYLEWDLA